ncbi:MAG TPA: hypothetical protein VD905_19940 [Flavobacteriales bacterium]|nr:hypothetical protein [Flavobacteriales bacterium]
MVQIIVGIRAEAGQALTLHAAVQGVGSADVVLQVAGVVVAADVVVTKFYFLLFLFSFTFTLTA